MRQPGELLRAARLDLGWTQSRTIFALTQQAASDHVGIADRTSLKTMLSRWENGRGQPDSIYQRLFCRIYERDEDELGFSEKLPPATTQLRVAPTVGQSTVDYFRNVFKEQVKADNLMGPHHLVDVVRAQTTLLEQVLPAARGHERQELLELACRYNEFAGWLYQDAGDPANAIILTDRAMDYALEIDIPRMKAYVLMRKSNISCDLGKADRALGLATAAMRDAAKLPPRVRALVMAQQVKAHATLGDASLCKRTIDQALHEVARSDADSDMSAAYCNEAYVSMESGAAFILLGEPALAIPGFERNLAAWPEHLRRDKGLCLARLAIAHTAQENIDQAVVVGRNALEVIRSATSGRSVLELTRLRRRLASWRRDGEVSDLCDKIRDLTRLAA